MKLAGPNKCVRGIVDLWNSFSISTIQRRTGDKRYQCLKSFKRYQMLVQVRTIKITYVRAHVRARNIHVPLDTYPYSKEQKWEVWIVMRDNVKELPVRKHPPLSS